MGGAGAASAPYARAAPLCALVLSLPGAWSSQLFARRRPNIYIGVRHGDSLGPEFFRFDILCVGRIP
jgi:hypothetical protein